MFQTMYFRVLRGISARKKFLHKGNSEDKKVRSYGDNSNMCCNGRETCKVVSKSQIVPARMGMLRLRLL